MASRANGLSATHFRLLDDLLRTKKLSATAANFGISVSSASRMLMQLREVFGEPLFTTTASGLQPTAAMLRMTPRLDAYLKAFDDLLAPAVFAPENISGTFYIASCGLVMPNILLRVFDQMQLRAPQLRITLAHRTPHLWDDLKAGRIDIGLTTAFDIPVSFRKTRLFRSPAVVLMRRGHPLIDAARENGGALAAEMLNDFPRGSIAINASAGLPTLERVVATLPEPVVISESGYDLLPLVEKTNLVMLAPLAGAEVAREHYAVTWLPAAAAGVADFEVFQVWTENKHLDPAHCWIRGLFEGAVRAQIADEAD